MKRLLAWALLCYALALAGRADAAECKFPDGHWEWPEGPCPPEAKEEPFPHVWQEPNEEGLIWNEVKCCWYGHGHHHYGGHARAAGRGHHSGGRGRR